MSICSFCGKELFCVSKKHNMCLICLSKRSWGNRMSFGCGSTWNKLEKEHIDITFLEFQYMCGDEGLDLPSWFEVTIFNFWFGVYW